MEVNCQKSAPKKILHRIKNKVALASCALGLLSPLANADGLLADKPNSPMTGQNKVVALYGNSYSHYNNHLNTRLRDLTRSLLPNRAKGYSFRGISTSSARLGWHIETLKFQNSLKHWDVVVFQGNSMEPISKKVDSVNYFKQSAKSMSEIAHQAGSKVVYLMTWARKANPEQTQKLRNSYIDIAANTGGFVAPVGEAFAQLTKANKEINLYHSDGKHPSLAGTYLTACVLFATLYNQSPVGGDVPIDSDMDPQTALKIQQVAWQTVNDFWKESI